jgi:hypothetical protein
VQGVLARNCDTYLDKLQAGLENDCEASVSIMSVWRAIHRSGYSLKKVSHSFRKPPCLLSFYKVTRVAMERNVEKRAAFTFRMGIMYSPEQFVFVDECSVDRRVGRGYGYALQGRRAVRKSFFVRGRR